MFAHRPVTTLNYSQSAQSEASAKRHVSASENCISRACWSVKVFCYQEKLPEQVESRAG